MKRFLTYAGEGLLLFLLLFLVGVLLLLWPKFLKQLWRPFISDKELNSPVDSVDRIVSKIIGVCCILGGLAAIVWMIIEYFIT